MHKRRKSPSTTSRQAWPKLNRASSIVGLLRYRDYGATVTLVRLDRGKCSPWFYVRQATPMSSDADVRALMPWYYMKWHSETGTGGFWFARAPTRKRLRPITVDSKDAIKLKPKNMQCAF